MVIAPKPLRRDYLYNFRKERGVSVEEMAASMGIPTALYKLVESGDVLEFDENDVKYFRTAERNFEIINGTKEKLKKKMRNKNLMPS